MMYNNKLACAIKSNGRVLREFGDKVYIPFGTEYTILIKNLHTVKALISITIDGMNVTDNGLIVDAGKEIELERYLKKDLNKGNKFKFIERTPAIEAHKGIGLEDGLVIISYQFEEQHYPVKMPIYYPAKPLPHIHWSTLPLLTIPINETICKYNGEIIGNIVSNDNVYNCNNTIKSEEISSINNANGITVPGDMSEQKFTTAYLGNLGSIKYNMIIKLLGEVNNKSVDLPVTVKIKPKCVTCGKHNKATSKFCNICGTSLQII